MMELIKAIFMGVIQGVTEFLPISSSGHLALFRQIFHMGDISYIFDVILHMGTLLAVFLVYWKDIKRIIIEGFGILEDLFVNIRLLFVEKLINGKQVRYRRIVKNAYRKFTLLVVVSTVPTGLIGYSSQSLVQRAGKTLLVPGFCLLITGVVLLISDNLENGEKTPKKTSFLDAIILGIVQGAAALPGISRFGTTATTGLALGLRRDFAVKYSFIMSIPAVIGAAIVKIGDIIHEPVDNIELAYYFAGMLVAAVVGFFCIRTLIFVIKGKKVKYFAYYCFTIGGISVVWHICSMLVQNM